MLTPQKKLQIADRRKRVAANILAGLTYSEIAAHLGVSVGTIQEDANNIRQTWQREQLMAADEYISQELRRLDTAQTAIWQKVLDGDLGAVDRFIKISQRRMKLLGLDIDETKITVDWKEEAQQRGIDVTEIFGQLVEGFYQQLESPTSNPAGYLTDGDEGTVIDGSYAEDGGGGMGGSETDSDDPWG